MNKDEIKRLRALRRSLLHQCYLINNNEGESLVVDIQVVKATFDKVITYLGENT